MSTQPTLTSDSFFHEIRCACCWRRLGISGSKKWGVYCDTFCAQDIPAVEAEARDAIIEAHHRDTDTPVAQVAKWLGFSRQRLYQLLDARDLRKQQPKT